ncbi:MAG: IS30 family transposase, partial [Peptococcaceae bacterium]|nr:IS30 family transposase [Peptococcaceae bacterium]
ELDPDGNRRAWVFYCDPASPQQKGALENNHEFLRRVIPKGKPMDHLTQSDVSLMMSHINSYARKSLGDRSPYEAFAFMHGESLLKKLGVVFIPPDEITLRPSLLQ